MRLCIIGEYPPIQGGTSRAGFWTALALAEQGVEVHLVTNATEVEPQFRICDEFYQFVTPTNSKAPASPVKVHSSTGDRAHLRYIPYANPYVTKLAGKAGP